jgi:alkylation response protein AidB-like acyl-CoA dehydrogenase
MDFSLSEEQQAIREMARDFALQEMAPHAAAWDENSIFPVETLRNAAELGMAGILVGEEHGGSALGRRESALIFEELSAGCTSTAAFLSIHNMHGDGGELLPDRAGLRLRRGGAQDPRRARQPGLHAERLQGFHLGRRGE